MNPRPLGYEPHDECLRCLAWSLVTALSSEDLRYAVFPDSTRLPRLRPSRHVRFTIRLHPWGMGPQLRRLKLGER